MISAPLPLVEIQNILRARGEFDAAWRLYEVYLGFKSGDLQLKLAYHALLRENGYHVSFMVEEADGFFYMALVQVPPEKRDLQLQANKLLGSLLEGCKCLPQHST